MNKFLLNYYFRHSLLMPAVIFTAASIITLNLLSGCGYSLRGTTSKEGGSIGCERNNLGGVKILHVKNKTFVPGLEDRLRFALIEELTKRGFCVKSLGIPEVGMDSEQKLVVEGSPENRQIFRSNDEEGKGISISAEITDIRLNPVAEKSGDVVIYELTILTNFQIHLPDGQVISKSLSSPFVTDFKTSEGESITSPRIEDILIQRDWEIQKVMKDIAIEVIYLILHI